MEGHTKRRDTWDALPRSRPVDTKQHPRQAIHTRPAKRWRKHGQDILISTETQPPAPENTKQSEGQAVSQDDEDSTNKLSRLRRCHKIDENEKTHQREEEIYKGRRKPCRQASREGTKGEEVPYIGGSIYSQREGKSHQISRRRPKEHSTPQDGEDAQQEGNAADETGRLRERYVYTLCNARGVCLRNGTTSVMLRDGTDRITGQAMQAII